MYPANHSSPSRSIQHSAQAQTRAPEVAHPKKSWEDVIQEEGLLGLVSVHLQNLLGRTSRAGYGPVSRAPVVSPRAQFNEINLQQRLGLGSPQQAWQSQSMRSLSSQSAQGSEKSVTFEMDLRAGLEPPRAQSAPVLPTSFSHLYPQTPKTDYYSASDSSTGTR